MTKFAVENMRKRLKSVNRIFLVLVAITLPFKNNINSLCIILFCVTSLLFLDWSLIRTSLKKSVFWLFSVLYFATIVFSLFTEPQSVNVFTAVESYATFLFLIPLIAFNPNIDLQVFKRINMAFVMSVFVACCICYGKSTIEYHSTGDYRVFYYHYLSSQIMINAIYLSLYCSYSFFWIISNQLVFGKQWVWRLASILMVVFFTITIFLLSSKLIIAIHMVLCFVLVLHHFFRRGKALLGIALVIIIGVLAGGAVSQMPYVRWRIEQTLLKQYDGHQDNQNGLAVRLKIWQISLQLIDEEPITGYGLRSGYTRLVDEYRKQDFTIALDAKYNAHNNYLQTMLNYGLPGLIALAGLLVSGFVFAFKSGEPFLSIIMTLITFLCLTECMLEVQKGIVFVGLFVPLLVYHGFSKGR